MDISEETKNAILLLERDLKLPDNSFHRIKEENDYGFILKGHIILVKSLTILFCTLIRNKDIFQLFEKEIDFDDKLDFIKAFNVLTEDELKFARLFTKVRNKLAHDPNFMFCTLEDIYNKEGKDKAYIRFFFGFRGDTEDGLGKQDHDWVTTNLRQSLEESFESFLAIINLETGNIDRREKCDQLTIVASNLRDKLTKSGVIPSI